MSQPSTPFWIKFIVYPLALLGLISLVLVFMLNMPLKDPKVHESVRAGAMAISQEGTPKRTSFQARDGTWLACRIYPAANKNSEQLAILVHGSSGSFRSMNMIGKRLAEKGITAVAIDVRGHGESGTRGDISYLGQLEDDLEDLLEVLQKAYPKAKRTLIGHSSGGGFALRIAASPCGHKFQRFVLLAPYLGHTAPTNVFPNEWVEVDLPRLLAINFLSQTGIDWLESMPTIAFATAPNAKRHVTPRYTYRLMVNFGPPADWQRAFQSAAAPIEVIAGSSDELMNSPAYKSALEPLGVKVTLLDGVDHMGVLYTPFALNTICESL
ncbi:MAG: alpha/beta fold hydrolase [Verrucomicrobia bacterium]|nr:alpha/beta fold hydrolase [Verrucomicrobiota bacterium]